MAQEPQELTANEWGTITYHPQWNTLELKWDQKTRSMGDDGFRETLQILAGHGLEVRPRYMIIDATEFFHTSAEGTLAWRDEHIVPLYNEAGVEKFAFLATDRAPGTVEKGAQPKPEGPASFPTGWFETKERMHAWLTS
ncbi:MAG TPA: hypothetical protein VF003_09295 [Pseudonocardiaceae bacterium]